MWKLGEDVCCDAPIFRMLFPQRLTSAYLFGFFCLLVFILLSPCFYLCHSNYVINCLGNVLLNGREYIFRQICSNDKGKPYLLEGNFSLINDMRLDTNNKINI